MDDLDDDDLDVDGFGNGWMAVQYRHHNYRMVRDRLHRAVRENRLDRAEWLVDGLCHDIDGLDEWGRSPLFVACAYDHIECARWLASKGADLAFEDPNSWTLAHVASSKGSLRCLQWLVDEHGLDVHKPITKNVFSGSTCVAVAFQSHRGQQTTLPWLMQRFPDTDLCAVFPNSNFYSDPFTCRFLLDRVKPGDRLDTDVLARTINPGCLRMILSYLRDKGLLDEYLSVHKAFNRNGDDGDLVVWNVFLWNYVVWETHATKVRLLLEFGADPDGTDALFRYMERHRVQPEIVTTYRDIVNRHRAWLRRKQPALWLTARSKRRRREMA